MLPGHVLRDLLLLLLHQGEPPAAPAAAALHADLQEHGEHRGGSTVYENDSSADMMCNVLYFAVSYCSLIPPPFKYLCKQLVETASVLSGLHQLGLPGVKEYEQRDRRIIQDYSFI